MDTQNKDNYIITLHSVEMFREDISKDKIVYNIKDNKIIKDMDDKYDVLLTELNNKVNNNSGNVFSNGILVAVRLREDADKIIIGEVAKLIIIDNKLSYEVIIDSVYNRVKVPAYDVASLAHADVLWTIANL